MDEYRVTTLDDYAPGSLREAVQAKGVRRVVFDVAGYIDLERALRIENPYLTIDGSTAPGRGVCIRHHEVYVRTHNVDISYLRFRLGDITENNVGHDSGVCLVVLLAKNAETEDQYPHHVRIDHCSFSWSNDTALDFWNAKWDKQGNNSGVPQIHDCVVSNCIIAEPLGSSHLHGTGLLIGSGVTDITMHHCLFAHSQARNPAINGGTHSVINCVWDDVVACCTAGQGPEDIGVPPASVNVVGSLGRRVSNRLVLLNPSRKEEDVGQQKQHRVFVDNNLGRVVTDITQDPWSEVGWGWGLGKGPADKTFQASEMIDVYGQPDRIVFPQQALIAVLEHSGCSLPARDAVDERILQDVANGTGTRIRLPSEVGGYPPLDDIGPSPSPSPSLPPELPDMPERGVVTIELGDSVYRGVVVRQDV